MNESEWGQKESVIKEKKERKERMEKENGRKMINDSDLR